MRWHAVVLAGSRGAGDPVAQATGVSHKAFARIGGKPMIVHVLDALAASPSIGAVSVVIEPSAPPLPAAGIARIDAESSPARSALAGFEAANGAPVLVTTADHPLLTAEMVEHFLGEAAATGADVAAGVARRAVVEQATPSARRTYLKFRDASVSGCNLFALTTPGARGALELWQRLEADRKRPLRMAMALGPLTVLRYAAGRLTTADAAAALGKAANCRAAMVMLPFPEAAHDVDKPADIVVAETLLKHRRFDV